MRLTASGSVMPGSAAQIDDLVAFGDGGDRRMHVQDDVAVLVDLRRHVQRNAGEHRLELRSDRCGSE
jgi:hypothetical protein